MPDLADITAIHQHTEVAGAEITAGVDIAAGTLETTVVGAMVAAIQVGAAVAILDGVVAGVGITDIGTITTIGVK